MNDRSTLLLEHHLKELKLPRFLREYGKMAAQCAAEGVDHPQYLLRLAELELIDRHQRMVERRIRAARFPAVKSLDSFDFPAIPSLNKALVMELARCEYIQRRENVIAVGNSGTGKTHIALVLGLAACRRKAPAELTETTGPTESADHRRTGLRSTVPDRRGAALRSVQPALRTGIHPGDHQPALRRVDRGLRLGAPHRRAAGPAHPPRPHPGDERRKLPTQAQPGKRCVPSPRRAGRRIGRTINAVSTYSCSVATLPDLLPSVIMSVVHDSTAPLAQHPIAFDTCWRLVDQTGSLGYFRRCKLAKSQKLN